MKKVVISNPGYPGNLPLLRLLSDAAYEAQEALARLLGNKVIVFGATVAGSNISNGAITYNGEVLPLTGGTGLPNVKIVETIQNGNYLLTPGAPATVNAQTGLVRTAVLTNEAIGANVFPFSDLRRAVNLAMVSAEGLVYIADVPNTAVYSVTIPNQGNSSYQIIPSLEAFSSVDNETLGNSSVQVSFFAKTPTSFKFRINEWGDSAQLYFRLNYLILKKL